MHFFSVLFATATVATGVVYLPESVVPTYAPIPAAANEPPVSNSTGYRVDNFGAGAYMVTDGSYQAAFFVTTTSVVVVDAPPTIGNKLLPAIRTITQLPVSHVVYSHAHADHIGAAYLYGSNKTLEIIAHRLTAEELAETSDPNRPAPTTTFEHSYKLQVDNQTLDLSYKGPNHEPGNIFIYSKSSKVLMVVDIAVPGWGPFASLMEAQNVPGFLKAFDQILAYDFDHYIGGHLDRSGTRADVQLEQEYLTDLFNNCKDALLLSGDPPNSTNPISSGAVIAPVIAANPGNSWAEFKVYLDTVADFCNNKTNEKWLTRLAGVDPFGPENAFAMMESIRIDYGILGPFGVGNSLT
ncbi:Metallo-hydrolase/oxidoreductase [Viridothelium virens]|uniref:Metallo-hydrolase/oxidoreductase n=1 Tax=Viridothelium virens TaxID=1048519 RepID=A0A6A6HBX2_VIRVR|nr:Metallo-hydrolase/oxidoreductase [Viridothelium virens]